VVVLGVAGIALVARFLVKKPPGDAAAVATFTGWVMLVAILLAPATRVGYLLYPINLFVWAWMLSRSDDPALAHGPSGGERGGAVSERRGATDGQLSSGSSNTSTENGVEPAEVVGETTTPTSQ